MAFILPIHVVSSSSIAIGAGAFAQSSVAVGASAQATGRNTTAVGDNEMTKLHIRHLVGGHAHAVKNEILYRLEFPERPGALMKFLNSTSHN